MTPNQLLRAFRAKNKGTPKELVANLLKECGEDGNINKVQVGDLVRKMLGEQQERDKVNETLKKLASNIDQNVRETLQGKIFADCGEHITKDRFLDAFEEHGLSFDRWDLLCLFYYLDAEDGIDEEIKMETIVKLISDLKGVPYVAPGQAPAKPAGKPGAQAAAAKPAENARPASAAKAMFEE